jgi:hypothetical protein
MMKSHMPVSEAGAVATKRITRIGLNFLLVLDPETPRRCGCRAAKKCIYCYEHGAFHRAYSHIILSLLCGEQKKHNSPREELGPH